MKTLSILMSKMGGNRMPKQDLKEQLEPDQLDRAVDIILAYKPVKEKVNIQTGHQDKTNVTTVSKQKVENKA